MWAVARDPEWKQIREVLCWRIPSTETAVEGRNGLGESKRAGTSHNSYIPNRLPSCEASQPMSMKRRYRIKETKRSSRTFLVA